MLNYSSIYVELFEAHLRGSNLKKSKCVFNL